MITEDAVHDLAVAEQNRNSEKAKGIYIEYSEDYINSLNNFELVMFIVKLINENEENNK